MDFGSGEYDGGLIVFDLISWLDQLSRKLDLSSYYQNQSDPGPYPIPENPNQEAGGDRHILVLDTDTCTLYEVYDASFDGAQWRGGSGAIWGLNSNTLRPDTWTSSDAAGLPILPGLVRYDEIAAGEIKHALRFTIEKTVLHLARAASDRRPTGWDFTHGRAFSFESRLRYFRFSTGNADHPASHENIWNYFWQTTAQTGTSAAHPMTAGQRYAALARCVDGQ